MNPNRGLLHHVEIYVSNLERSLEFWSWLLGKFGYVESARWDAGASLKLGATYLVFVQTEERFLEPAYHRCRTGLNHLAFHASDEAEVLALSEELRARGTTILYEDKHPYAGGAGYCAVFFEDPDRMKVEVVAPKPKRQG